MGNINLDPSPFSKEGKIDHKFYLVGKKNRRLARRPLAQWEKTLKRAGNFNWWTYNSIEIKVGGIKINVIWGLYIPKTIRCIKIYF